MTLTRYAVRRDRNERPLVTLAERLGARWVRGGPLDGWVLFRGVWTPTEIKAPDVEGHADEFTDVQRRFIAFCTANSGPWQAWRTGADVMHSLRVGIPL